MPVGSEFFSCARYWRRRRNCWLLFLSVIFTILFPFLLLIISPLFLYRFILSLLVPVLNPRIKCMLDPASSLFASQGVYSRKDALSSLSGVGICRNPLELDQLRVSFTKNVLQAQDPRYSDGRLLFPQLKQQVTLKYGYYWWEEITDFDLSTQLRYYDGKFSCGDGKGTVTDDRFVDEEHLINEIIQEGLTTPLRKGTSPWELLVFHWKQNEKTYIAHRYNHCLADSSIYNMWRTWGGKTEYSEIRVRNQSGCGSCFMSLYRLKNFLMDTMCFLIFGPYNIIDQYFISQDSNAWTQVDPNDWTGRVNISISPPVQLEDLKQIRNQHGVRMLSLILACYSEALRTCMREMKMEIPSAIHCLVPLSLPSPSARPELGLGNFFTTTAVQLPLGEEDRLKRLALIHKNVARSLKLPPKLNALTIRLWFSLPTCFFKNDSVKRNVGPCTVLQTPHAPPEPIVLCDCDGQAIVTNCIFGSKIQPGLGPCLQSQGYDGKIRFLIGADTSVVTNQLVLEAMTSRMLEQVEYFRNSTINFKAETKDESELEQLNHNAFSII